MSTYAQVVAAENVGNSRTTPDEHMEALFRTHGDFVWRSLRRLGVPDASAEDALQDVLLVAHRKLDTFQPASSMRAWLFAISRRVASQYRRSAQRARRRLDGVVVEPPSDGPEEAVAAREAIEAVNAFLDELDEPRRMVFFLAEIEGLRAPEIAAALDVNLNTVYTRLRAGRKRFEQMLEKRAERGDP